MKKRSCYAIALLMLLCFISCETEETVNEIIGEKEVIEEVPEIEEGLFAISFPDKFVRTGTDVIHIIISDSLGNPLENKRYDSETAKIITFSALKDYNDDTEFILTFVQVIGSNSQIFDFFVYSNLTKNNVGNFIKYNPRALSIGVGTVEIDVPFYENGYEMRSYSSWSGMQYFTSSSKFTGHYSSNTNNNLGLKNNFVRYYNKNIEDSYSYTLVENFSSKNLFEESEFTKEHVETKELSIIGSNHNPFLGIYGFDSEDHFMANNGHEVFKNYLGTDLSPWQYSYPKIYDYNRYELQIGNFMIESSGFPPSEIMVPQENVDFGLEDGKIHFEGVAGYEVGRVRLKYTDDVHLLAEFTFNGASNEVIIPKMPDGLFPLSVRNVFAENKMEEVQCAAVNYEAFNSYDEFISNIIVKAKPFYTISKRESIFKSPAGFWLPVYDFPF